MVNEVSIPQFEGFDGSGGNDEKNRQRHHVAPSEAEQVFFNCPLLVADDEAHSQYETRYYVLGQTNDGRKLFIAFTMRKKLIRVISCRDMNQKERKVYQSS